MIEHRNATRGGHILTIEDPIEFVFKHKRCVINQREVGLDTQVLPERAGQRHARGAGYHDDRRNARQRDLAAGAALRADRPPVHVHPAREQQLPRAQPHHQLFPYDARPALLHDLAVCLRAVISQRLVKAVDGRLVAAVEVLLNSKHIAELIVKGEIDQIKEAIEKSLSPGSVRLRAGPVQAVCRGQDHQGRGAAQLGLGHQPVLADEQRRAEGGAGQGRLGKVARGADINATSFDHFKIDINAGN